MNEKLVIYAENRPQAVFWAREAQLAPNEWHYLQDIHSFLYGMHQIHLWEVGTKRAMSIKEASSLVSGIYTAGVAKHWQQKDIEEVRAWVHGQR